MGQGCSLGKAKLIKYEAVKILKSEQNMFCKVKLTLSSLPKPLP